ncbi:hypothetical protein Cch01nite_40490 [Cellulomonas chitinilytica]|uniref:Uncharacterized protein n=1 Tax=Cellulomonas chitinilytica TaxID=398759 RepID=A0A919P6T8_9CELL|nr:hypothetical protein Cch01nite_40490 [Cellulomonas chitinilytica]
MAHVRVKTALVPTVRLVCDLGTISVARLQDELEDLSVLLDFAHNLALGLGLRYTESGRVETDAAWFLEEFGQARGSFNRGNRRGDGPYFPRRGEPVRHGTWQMLVQRQASRSGEVSGTLAVVPTPASTQVTYLSFANPLETWVQLLGGTGVLGATLLVGKFLRDFGAERRIGKARARS